MTRTIRKLFAITCTATLIQGASCFPTGNAFSTNRSTSAPRFVPNANDKGLNLGSFSLHLSASNLLPSLRSSIPQDDSLINNRYSASDWLHNVFTLPRSSVLRDIKNPVLSIALWSTLVSVFHRLIRTSSNKLISKFASDMCIGGAPHSFLVSSLGLLLVFRTNSAYQRFNEGRVIWENILSISRNLSRMTALYVKEVGAARQDRIIRLLAAFPYLLRHHVRPGCLCEVKHDIPKEDQLLLKDRRVAVVDTRYEGDKAWRKYTVGNGETNECYVNRQNYPWRLFQSESSLEKVTTAQNRPLWVCDRIGREIMSIPYSPMFTSRERLSLLSSVEKLTNTVGQCERIHQTAVPLNYARHSLRGLTLWLVTLPFCLVKEMGLLTGPAMAVISWLLFGVYQIGYSIEDPFQGSLRLSILSDAIRKDVLGETLQRESAYSLQDAWEDDDDDDNISQEADIALVDTYDDDDKDQTLRELDRVQETVSPYIPPANNQSDLILNAPSLIKENGSWNVVGMIRDE